MEDFRAGEKTRRTRPRPRPATWGRRAGASQQGGRGRSYWCSRSPHLERTGAEPEEADPGRGLRASAAEPPGERANRAAGSDAPNGDRGGAGRGGDCVGGHGEGAGVGTGTRTGTGARVAAGRRLPARPLPRGPAMGDGRREGARAGLGEAAVCKHAGPAPAPGAQENDLGSKTSRASEVSSGQSDCAAPR